MKKGSFFLLVLLVLRICLVPIGFAYFANELKNPGYEQVNAKKGHFPSQEQRAYIAGALNWSPVACIFVQRLFPLTSKKSIATSLFAAIASLKYHMYTPVIAGSIYVSNMTLRI